jgi:hypothetical protein
MTRAQRSLLFAYDRILMAYDEGLADRIRELLGGEAGLTEKKMFGGLAFLIGGNMAVAASGQGGVLARSTHRCQTSSSPARTLASWRCVAGECRDGYESTLMTSAPSGSSRGG